MGKIGYNTVKYIWGRGFYILFHLEITEGGLDNDDEKCDDVYRLGSAGV
nr:MAG TPA: hypothetical protein [Caudoviricetes sp.]